MHAGGGEDSQTAAEAAHTEDIEYDSDSDNVSVADSQTFR